MPFAINGLPSGWQVRWQAMEEDLSPDDDGHTLEEWLQEVYFDNDKHADFTKNDIANVGKLIARMLKFEPSLRTAASDALADPWFEEE